MPSTLLQQFRAYRPVPSQTALQSRRSRTVQLIVETLDDRIVPTVFTVTTGSDSGPGSLRQAILDSNANPGPDTIAFGIGGGGIQTIAVTAPLPDVSDPVVIDGSTQPGFSQAPLIVVNGSAFNGGSAGFGLHITAGNCTIQDLVVNGFSGAEIQIDVGGNDVVVGNYLGTDVTGTAAVTGNVNISNVGLLVLSGDNQIGGSTAGAGNLISGHNYWGIDLSGGSATGNRIQGNMIGTDITGTVALGNFGGVVADGASSNLIGGTTPGAGNLISSNLSTTGIGLVDSSNNLIQGNRIGTDMTGTLRMGNRTGVYIQGGSGNVIGGTDAGAGNLISGSTGSAPSAGWGIFITEGSSGPASDDQILGNFVGTDVSGMNALPNNNDGIRVDFASVDVTIGGASSEARNVVSGNKQNGIYVTSGEGNVIQGNYAGTNAAGTAALPNGDCGVNVGGKNNTVGGNLPGAGNLLSGNANYGVALSGNQQLVQGNRIGTDATGTVAVPNTLGGMDIAGVGQPGQSIIGGTDPGAGNLISGNTHYGIRVTGGNNNQILGNWIGTDETGTLPLGNGQFGVAIDSGTGNIIGGTTPGTGNVVAANGTGVSVTTNGNSLLGNWIGTDVSGAIPLGNGVGVFLTFSSKVVGGTAAGAGNTIAFNTGSGVVVDGVDGGTGLQIEGNSIHANGGLGIDLGGDGVTPNDLGDGDVGPNGLQNFPVLSQAISGVTTRISGSLNSAAQSAFTLDFYANTVVDPLGMDEGARYLGSANVSTDANGDVLFDLTLNAPTFQGEVVTATATDAAGSTSEFSAAVLVNGFPSVTVNAGLTVNQDQSADITAAILTAADPEGQPVTYAVTNGPAYGALQVGGNTATTFSQADINAGLVKYVHDGTRLTVDTFTIVVSDGILTSEPVVVNITVNTEPILIFQPAAQATFAGAVALFTAAVDASPLPTVQWQVSSDGGHSFHDVAGATQTTLLFKVDAAQDGDLFRARFTNVAGTATTSGAALTVTPGLVIESDPTAQLVQVGTKATFMVTTSGAAAKKQRVQWQVSQDGGTTFSNIPGAVALKLRVKALAPVDHNLYRAMFTTSAGRGMTVAAALSVDYTMTLAGARKNLTIPVGADIVPIGSVQGLTSPTVHWEMSTDKGKTYSDVAGATSATLAIRVPAADSGKYFRAVFVSGTKLRRTGPAVLTVGDPPTMLAAPANALVEAGGTAMFNFTMTAMSGVKVQWQVSTDGGRTFTNIHGAIKPSLILKNVKAASDRSVYRAQLSNAFDQTVTSAATLTVT